MYPVAAFTRSNGFGSILYAQFNIPRAQFDVTTVKSPCSRFARTGERISTKIAIIIGSAAPVRVSTAYAASDISDANPSVSINIATNKALQLTPVFTQSHNAVGTIATHSVAAKSVSPLK